MEPGELRTAPAGLVTPYDSSSRDVDGFPGPVVSYSTSNPRLGLSMVPNLPIPEDSVARSQDSPSPTRAPMDSHGRMRGGVSPPKTPPPGPLVSQLNKPLTTRSHRTDQTPLVQLDLTTLGRERPVSQPVHTMHPSPDASTYAGTGSAQTSGTALTVDTRNSGPPGTRSSSSEQQSGQGDSPPSGQGSRQDSGPRFSSGESSTGPHPVTPSPVKSPVRDAEYPDEFFLTPGLPDNRSQSLPVIPVPGALGIPPPVAVDFDIHQYADGPQTSLMQPFPGGGRESIPLLTGALSVQQIRHDNPVQTPAPPPGAVSPGLIPAPGTPQYVPIPLPTVVPVPPVFPPGSPVFQEGSGASPAVSQLDLSFAAPPQTASAIAPRHGFQSGDGGDVENPSLDGVRVDTDLTREPVTLEMRATIHRNTQKQLAQSRHQTELLTDSLFDAKDVNRDLERQVAALSVETETGRDALISAQAAERKARADYQALYAFHQQSRRQQQGLLQQEATGRQAVMELQAHGETLKGQLTQVIGERENATQAAAVLQERADGFETELEARDRELRAAREQLTAANQDSAQYTQGLASLQGVASQLYGAMAQVNPLSQPLTLTEIIERATYMTNQLWVDKRAAEQREAALQAQLAASVTTVKVNVQKPPPVMPNQLPVHPPSTPNPPPVTMNPSLVRPTSASQVPPVMMDSSLVPSTSTSRPHPAVADSSSVHQVPVSQSVHQVPVSQSVPPSSRPYSATQPIPSFIPPYVSDGGPPTVTQSLHILQAKQQPFTYVQPGYQPPRNLTVPVQPSTSTVQGIVPTTVSAGQHGLGAQLTAPLPFPMVPPVPQNSGIPTSFQWSPGQYPSFPVELDINRVLPRSSLPGQQLVNPPRPVEFPGSSSLIRLCLVELMGSR